MVVAVVVRVGLGIVCVCVLGGYSLLLLPQIDKDNTILQLP